MFVNLVNVLLRAVKIVLAFLKASIAVGQGFPVFQGLSNLLLGLYWSSTVGTPLSEGKDN